MIFTITNITRCSGLGHYNFTVNVGAQTIQLQVHREEFDLEPTELRDAFVHRVRSALKEANANTFAQAQNALLNIQFEI